MAPMGFLTDFFLGKPKQPPPPQTIGEQNKYILEQLTQCVSLLKAPSKAVIVEALFEVLVDLALRSLGKARASALFTSAIADLDAVSNIPSTAILATSAAPIDQVADVKQCLTLFINTARASGFRDDHLIYAFGSLGIGLAEASISHLHVIAMMKKSLASVQR